MIHPTELQAMSREEKLKYAKMIGVKVHHKLSDKNIDMAISEHLTAQDEAPKVKAVVEKPAPVVVEELTQDTVLEAVQEYVDRGMRVKFLDEGKSWAFAFGNKVDTGSMSMPLSRVKLQAISVMTPSRLPQQDGIGKSLDSI